MSPIPGAGDTSSAWNRAQRFGRIDELASFEDAVADGVEPRVASAFEETLESPDANASFNVL